MARCARCEAETELFVAEVPVCLKCQLELSPEPETQKKPFRPDGPEFQQPEKTRASLLLFTQGHRLGPVHCGGHLDIPYHFRYPNDSLIFG